MKTILQVIPSNEELWLVQQIQQNDQGCNLSKCFIQTGIPLNLITDFSMSRKAWRTFVNKANTDPTAWSTTNSNTGIDKAWAFGNFSNISVNLFLFYRYIYHTETQTGVSIQFNFHIHWDRASFIDSTESNAKFIFFVAYILYCTNGTFG